MMTVGCSTTLLVTLGGDGDGAIVGCVVVGAAAAVIAVLT